jgi:hypothetical protein
MKIPALILTSYVLLLITTLNIANATSNPIPFLPPIQHSQTQWQPSEHLQPPQQQQQMSQPLHSNEMPNTHNNQFDNHSPTVTSVMPF